MSKVLAVLSSGYKDEKNNYKTVGGERSFLHL
jgi:hypothetical protein